MAVEDDALDRHCRARIRLSPEGYAAPEARRAKLEREQADRGKAAKRMFP